MISFDEDILPPGVYTGFFKGGCRREAPKKNFSHPGADLLRNHPPFRISPFLDQLQKKISRPVPTPTSLFAFLPFWTNFNFAHTLMSQGPNKKI